MNRVLPRIAALILLLSPAPGRSQVDPDPADSLAYGMLIPASATMQRAWEIPRNPFLTSVFKDSLTMELVRYGYKLFTNTPYESILLSGNSLSCSNCHLNAGQREKALPLVGINAAYPEYNKRAGRLMTVEDRIVECFNRGIDAALLKQARPDTAEIDSTLNRIRQLKEVISIAAYIGWLSGSVNKGEKIPWRGQNTISAKDLISINRLDTARGRLLFLDKCISCHGEDGQGVFIGDKKAGPLWGKESWNDGAGAARIYTLAGIIRYMMPYLDPGSLTDEEAQDIAAFINSQERPVYPFKAFDYRGIRIPEDALYYFREVKK